MLYFRLDSNDQVTHVTDAIGLSTAYPTVPPNVVLQDGWTDRNDFSTLERAAAIAESATRATGERYIPTDAGPHCSPRFDVVRAPALGDSVSKGFNGDYYPCGRIVKISDTGRVITTDDGTRFYRFKNTGSWKHGPWSLVRGHVDQLNPSF